MSAGKSTSFEGRTRRNAVGRRLQFDLNRFRDLIGPLGLKTEQEIADFLGVDASYYNRIVNGRRGYGERFIVAVLTAPYPGSEGVSFEVVFPIVDGDQ